MDDGLVYLTIESGYMVPVEQNGMERLKLEDFSALFDQFTRNAFRVETLVDYDPHRRDRRFLNFLRGGDSKADVNTEFLADISEKVKSGKSYDIVRVIPVGQEGAPYIQYEIQWRLPENYAAGMRFRFIRDTQISPTIAQWIGKDFWVFDDETVVAMQYADNGEYMAAFKVTDPSLMAEYLAHKILLLESGTPWNPSPNK